MDINSLREAFAVEQGMTKSGKLIIKSSNASKVLTPTHWLTYSTMNVTVTLTLRQLFRDTSNKVDYPSPIDRSRGDRFAIRAVQFIEDHCDVLAPYRYELTSQLMTRKS